MKSDKPSRNPNAIGNTFFTKDVKQAIEVMKQGGVILYPTDTVWGIGCDATNAEDSKAMICLVDSDVRLQRYVRNVPDVAWDLMEYATKPTTVVLDGATGLAENLVAGDGSIAVRITRDLFSRELCYRFQKPIVSTSANISGQPTPRRFTEISEDIIKAVDYVCTSRREERKTNTPSSIIKLTAMGEVTIIRE